MQQAERYNPAESEPRWQKVWEERNAFRAEDGSRKKKAYVLVEFPYPSGDGLHVGHVRSFTAIDAVARLLRMQGRNVLYPMGWDAFGLPTENYALKTGVHPRIATDTNIANFKRQMQSLGLSFDWSREFDTTDPKYYRWTQWIFLQLFKQGLAYQAEIPINWCPQDKIGLANEEVVAGKCERCGTPVTRQRQKQWMLKITAYADRLLQDLDTVDYPERIKTQQVNWIGKSEGAEIEFGISNQESGSTEGRRALGVGRRRYVLLHGFRGNAKRIFFPWLRKKLEATGAEVIAPDLPDSNHPTEEEQVGYVLKNIAFDENTVLFGHSLGTVVALKVLERLQKPIAGTVLAAGFTTATFKDKPRPFQTTFSWDFHWTQIKKNAGFVKVLRATEDVAVPAAATRALAQKLGVEMVDGEPKKTHFTGSREPAILDALVPSIRVFTTRPDTLFGATYLVLSPEHPLIANRELRITNEGEVRAYVDQAARKSDLERTDLAKEKTGVELQGVKAVNPVNGEAIPIWVADYVLSTYGTGAIMAVPGHDERDYAFAKKFGLEIREVVKPKRGRRALGVGPSEELGAYVGDGMMVNSGGYDGLDNHQAGQKIVAKLKREGKGQPAVQYKLRDWVFSRQHYWGEPIPIIHCPEHGAVPVPEDQLPVELPYVEKYQPTGTGESPLAAVKEWVNTTCPICQKPAKRETDTMPNWAGSSWYFLRYTDPHNAAKFADLKQLTYWLPVDLYNGGMEHTVLHLLYSRFWYKFLFDQKLVPTSEPYAHRHSHGIVLAPDGRKMSKSFGNVINPDELVAQYGADALRLYELFMGPYEEMIPWSPQGIVGTRRFLERVWDLFSESGARMPGETVGPEITIQELQRIQHSTVKKVTSDLEAFRFNTAVSAVMEFSNSLRKANYLRIEAAYEEAKRALLLLLYPLAPHLTSELWSQHFGGDIHDQSWPVYNARLAAEDEVTVVVQVAGKRRDAVRLPKGSNEATVRAAALALDSVKRHLPAEPKRVVFVPDRLVNFIP